MKTLVLLLTAAFALVPAAPARAAETVAVVVSGAPLNPVPSYRAGGELYLEAKRIGEIYGGQVYWYPVSGRVQLSLRGRSLQFVVDSKKASAGAERFALSAPVIVRASRAYVPLSFLHSDAFARWSGYDARFDPATETVQIDRRTTAGPVRAFSYKGRTRIAVELSPGVEAKASARGVGALEISVPFGVVDGDDRVDVDDGIVAFYAVKQEAREAKVTVRFAASGQRWKSAELSDPRRLIVDVYAPGATPPAGVPDVAEGETKPAAPSHPEEEAPAQAVAVSSPASVAAASKKTPPPPPAPPRRRIIVVDAGHGGKDPGATGTRGTKEKDITLAAALELAKVLRERGDFDVVLTRTDDTFVPLSDRSKKANDLNADLFVSLHCNAASNHREKGYEVYSVSETASDPEAERLAAAENAALELEGKKPGDEAAKQILLAMTKTEMINESAPFAALVEREVGRHVDVSDRGQKQAGFYVLRGTHAPAILVEMAFVSNPKDEAELGSRRFRRKMAEGVAAGIADYARKKGWLQ
ncbi:MAG: N-acetylmuramoyl-L-alanine amidase [Elusimicrobia bacterium]|nr:N-acetylmuramoyl-L-alanine amidase [Elusimicrobiota bacterium]